MNSIRCLPMLIQVAIIVLICCSTESKKQKQKDGAKKVREGKSRRLNVSSNDTTIKLRCGKRDLIYSIDIISYAPRSGKPVCSGLQPNVLTDSINCYWGRKCSIVVNSIQPIVRTCCVDCVGLHPNKLSVNYRCLKKDKIKFLRTKENMSVTSDNGMLVSHKNFPWHYRKSINATVTLKPKDKSKTKLLLMTHRMDIAKYDRVRMYDSNGEVQFTSTKEALYNATTPAGQAVHIHFDTSSDSSGAQGFVYCYYWATESFIPDKDICQLVKGPMRGQKNTGGRAKNTRDGAKNNRGRAKNTRDGAKNTRKLKKKDKRI